MTAHCDTSHAAGLPCGWYRCIVVVCSRWGTVVFIKYCQHLWCYAKDYSRAVSDISTDVGNSVAVMDNDAVVNYSRFAKLGFNLQNIARLNLKLLYISFSNS